MWKYIQHDIRRRIIRGGLASSKIMLTRRTSPTSGDSMEASGIKMTSQFVLRLWATSAKLNMTNLLLQLSDITIDITRT
jgi:hypothetical protein